MKIVLVEPNLSGHHKVYLKAFANTLQSLDHKVVIYSREDIEGFETRIISHKKFYKLPQNLFLRYIYVILNFMVTCRNIISLRCKLQENNDLVFFCAIDDYMHDLLCPNIFEMLFPYRFSGLLMNTCSVNSKIRFDKRKIMSSKKCLSIAVLDEFCSNDIKRINKNIIHFPDFADDALPSKSYALANEVKEKARGRKIISLLGALDLRKGIYTFVRASMLMDKEKYFFVIAGKSFLLEKDYSFISNNFVGENCIFSGETIPTESDFNALVNISDVIYAAYIDFRQSSNMFSKASLFKKKLIVSKGYYMEKIVEKYRLGVSILQNSPEECTEAIKYLTCHENILKDSDWDGYLKNNSFSNISKSFSEIISLI